MKRAVFLDRDGVINQVLPREGGVSSPRALEEFRLVDGIVKDGLISRESTLSG